MEFDHETACLMSQLMNLICITLFLKPGFYFTFLYGTLKGGVIFLSLVGIGYGK